MFLQYLRYLNYNIMYIVTSVVDRVFDLKLTTTITRGDVPLSKYITLKCPLVRSVMRTTNNFIEYFAGILL